MVLEIKEREYSSNHNVSHYMLQCRSPSTYGGLTVIFFLLYDGVHIIHIQRKLQLKLFILIWASDMWHDIPPQLWYLSWQATFSQFHKQFIF